MSSDSTLSAEPDGPIGPLPNHHYVPKFILKNFATAKSGNKVAAYDKSYRREELKAVKRAATGPGYNTRSDGTDAVEQFLSRDVETPAALAIKALVSGESPDRIDERQVTALRKLLLAQMVRTPRARRVISLMIHSGSELASWPRLDFDESGQLTMDGQLDVVASLLRGWSFLGSASWRLRTVPFSRPGPPLFVPDNGAFLYHPELRSSGWIESSIDDMASMLMPLSPRLALVALNPDFSYRDVLPAPEEVAGLIWGQADRFIYGRREDGMAKRFASMMTPES